MRRVYTWLVRDVVRFLLCLEAARCQHVTEHRKVPQRTESLQDFEADRGGIQGSWGSWGPWSACSLTCGGGVQEQSRPCLRVSPHLRPGHVISALRPSVSVYRDGSGHEGKRSPSGGSRRIIPIIPGRYGYGRAPLQDSGRVQRSQPDGQRRSAVAHRGGLRSRHLHRSGPHTQTLWAPLYQQGQRGLPSGGQRSGSQEPEPQLEQPYHPLPASSCTGKHNHLRLCDHKACPTSSKHIRAAQCSMHDKKPFMGRLYEWEPFNEVAGEQHCELNCRAAGFRFYVRLSDKVVDGTPCGRNDTSVCVAGKCTSPGCDGFLGSGKVIDKCGACGGTDATCRLVSGFFRRSLTKIGYHKIAEIPQGATKINVTEMAKSSNYLALRSRSGRSIINGNWAIDRPGKYEGGGTVFTYRRPNEISNTAGESLLAEGPTNEILEVYMIFQQPNPGVHYEYVVTSETPQGNTVNEQEVGHDDSQQGNYDPASRGKYPPHRHDNQVPRRQREYSWKMAGTSECSTSCGKGFRHPVFHCIHRLNQVQVEDILCNGSSKPMLQEEPCNLQACPTFWDIGEWSECSKTCGLGTQQRQVLCRQTYANHTHNVHASRCGHLERPETAGTCQTKICSEWHIRSEWSACSVPCGLGQRWREVRCVSNVGDFVPDTECNMNLRPVHVENCDRGACAKSWFYTDWSTKCSAECGMGVRTRGILCLTNHMSSLPLEGCGSERPPDSQVCNTGPCDNAMEWFTGPWSQCSAECGAGSQQRAVVCLTRSHDVVAVAPQYECSSLERPLSRQSCNVKACGAKWYYTEWSACSKTCEGGFRVREVRCLSEDMQSSTDCEERLKPAEREDCNPEPCIPQIDEHCKDEYYNCNVVVQARLCVYDYYKKTCCASCSRHPHRHSVVHRGRS
ncbi:thrombospondin type-1 domain-containing protein 4-like isoform X1 [Phyllopteryx taeniolatus]|uniref:thrombospondin type-1 domain-containing protein 4-like isoform X1 n=2 Tax=Phyllopteryx taeniolatus TaxID=161469 RepID=UPI002AD4327C|nr:thrombospondin type-1 domain-containing protein 4-like isoform X1 [Phyllopteryx taeniolatus]